MSAVNKSPPIWIVSLANPEKAIHVEKKIDSF